MKYTIDNNGVLKLDEPNYWILSGELNNMSIGRLNEIIEDMEDVFNGKFEESSFSENVIVVNFNKSYATIEDYEKILGKEPVLDFYDMLKKIRDVLLKE